MGRGEWPYPSPGALTVRRPLFFFSALFLAELALFLGWGGWSGLAAACAVLPFAVWTRSNILRRHLLLCGLLSLLLAIPVVWSLQRRLERWQALEGETVEFCGWVAQEEPYGQGRVRLHGSILQEGKSQRVMLELRGLGEELLPGQWAAGRVLVLSARKDGDALGGVSLLGRVEGALEPLAPPPGLHLFPPLAALRQRLSTAVWEARPGDAAAVSAAILFSRQDLLSPEGLKQLNRAGMRHLLVVSGLHLSIAVGWLRGIRRLGLGERASSLVALAGVWFLAGLAGFSVSVLRAAIMASLALLARLCWARADSLTSLGAAALVLALASPPVLLQAGFQLTFAASLGLLLGQEPLFNLGRSLWEGRFGSLGRGPRWVLEGLSSSFCAQLGAAPVLAAHFGYFTPWGLLTSLLALPLVMGILLAGWAGAALAQAGAVFSPAASLLLACARMLAGGMLLLAELAGALPGAVLPVLLPWQLALCVLVPAEALGWLLLRPRLRRRSARSLFFWGLAGIVLTLGYAGLYYRGGTLISASGETGGVVVATPGGTVALAGEGEGYHRRRLAAQLERCQGAGPLVLVCSWDTGPNGILALHQELSPAVTLVPEGELALLQAQSAGPFLPIPEEPAEVLPGLWVGAPLPQLLTVETNGRKLLKSWAGYGIINESNLPPGGDLLVDMDGRVYPLSPELRPQRLPTGDTNLILPRKRG